MRGFLFQVAVMTGFLLGLRAQATFNDEAVVWPEAWGEPTSPALFSEAPISPAERYFRTVELYHALGVAAEPSPQSNLEEVATHSSPKEIESLLKGLDPRGQAERFFEWEPGIFRAYRDRDSREVLDFELKLSPLKPFHPGMKSLKGVKVAIDPGHMGGKFWETRSGKYIRDGARRLSEAVMATQVALLLERELEKRGAEVLVTRRGLGPVSELDYKGFDLTPYADRELQLKSLEGWFQSLISSHDTEQERLDALLANQNYKWFYSKKRRFRYFNFRSDIPRRGELIEAFDPDLTLVIHFDVAVKSGSHGLNPKIKNRTKAYVPGAVQPVEWATREQRSQVAHQLLHAGLWKRSVRLGSEVTRAISEKLDLPLQKKSGSQTERVAPGVFARNLILNRYVKSSPIAFLECFYYNEPKMFNALMDQPFELKIDGKVTRYSQKLKDLTAAILLGVERYLKI